MNDEDLIRDIEQAKRRLDASLKVCRRIIESYQSDLSRLAQDSAAAFPWEPESLAQHGERPSTE